MMCEYCSWEACIMNDCMANQWQCWFTAAIAEMMITVSHGFVVTPMTFLFRRRFITCCPYSVDILFHVVLIPHSVYLQVMIIRRRFISFCPNSDVGWRKSIRPQIWWRYTHTAVDNKPISAAIAEMPVLIFGTHPYIWAKQNFSALLLLLVGRRWEATEKKG